MIRWSGVELRGQRQAPISKRQLFLAESLQHDQRSGFRWRSAYLHPFASGNRPYHCNLSRYRTLALTHPASFVLPHCSKQWLQFFNLPAYLNRSTVLSKFSAGLNSSNGHCRLLADDGALER
jgi:hypothetical protein